jgi:hypothetical protein
VGSNPTCRTMIEPFFPHYYIEAFDINYWDDREYQWHYKRKSPMFIVRDVDPDDGDVWASLPLPLNWELV